MWDTGLFPHRSHCKGTGLSHPTLMASCHRGLGHLRPSKPEASETMYQNHLFHLLRW